jgi:beta-fructofuranosidase
VNIRRLPTGLFFRSSFAFLVAIAFPFRNYSAETDTDALARAEAAVRAAAPRAQADPARPIFHVTAPAQWINDPNGPIYYHGRYHLFYQLHPFSDGSGPKYWGHVRSPDLVRWEHLPIALAPSQDLGESEIWSGCCTINGEGKPMIFYTSIAPDKPAKTHAEQWAALGGDDLINWHKSSANPVLSEALHGDKKIYEWRDPFIFQEGKQTFLVTGGNLNETKGGQAVVNIYEAQNPGFTEWKYRGVLFQLPDPKARTAECPNFFRLGNQWVLFVSPYGKVQYFAGDFDANTCRFTSRTQGLLDFGPNFYAPNTMLVPDGRRIVWGWINGFPGGHGWNGCLSVPRALSWSRDGQLRQSPAPQLEKLRCKGTALRNVRLDSESHLLQLPKTNSLEIFADIDIESSEGITLEFTGEWLHKPPLTIALYRSDFKVPKADLTLPFNQKERKLNLRIFVDHLVLEVFANDTTCATKVIPPLDSGASLRIGTLGGTAEARRIECWPMKTIW